MKKTIRRSVALFTSLLLITSFSQAQSCLKWITDIGGNNDDGESEGKVIAVSNGFIVCGKTNSNNPLFGVPPGHGNDAYVAKYDVNGNIAWRHIYGGSGEDFFNSVIQTADGGFIAAGHTSSNDGDVSGNHGGNGDAWVVKISADGTLQWQKCYGGSGDDIFFSISAEATGYILTGTTNSHNGDITSWFGDYDVWIVKLSLTGTIAWQSNYGGSNFEESRSIVRNTDGTYIFAGTTKSSNQQVGSHPGGSYDTWVVKISNIGNIIWKKVYGGKGYDYCNGLARTSDGNIVLGQSSNSTDGDVNGTGSFAMWLLKINPQSGDIIWSKTFSGSPQGTGLFGIFSTSDGGVISLGSTGSADDVTWDAYILAADGNGNKKWSSFLGGTKSDYAKAGVQINSDDLIILCSSASTDGDFAGGSGNPDIWLAKFHHCDDNTATKASPANNLIETNTYKFSAYPNPFSSATSISFSLAQSAKVSLKVFDLNGRLIKTLANKEMVAGSHEIKWNVNAVNSKSISSGIYLLRIEVGDFNDTKKIFVIK
jgi:hypothetical protein